MGRGSRKEGADAAQRRSSGSVASNKWKMKPGSEDDAMEEATNPSADDGPAYGKSVFLQVYQALKIVEVKPEQVGDAETEPTGGAHQDESAPPAESDVSVAVVLGERPEPEGGLPERTGRRAQWEAKRAERAARRASEGSIEPGTPSAQKIALSAELGTSAAAPGTPTSDPTKHPFFNSMTWPIEYPPQTTGTLRNIPGVYTLDMLANPASSPPTMLVWRGIPTNIKRDDLIQHLDTKFKGCYDFLYLPGDNSGKSNRSLAYINFRSVDKAWLFEQQFQSAKYFEGDTEKECIVEKCRMASLEKNLRTLKASMEKPGSTPKKAEWHPVLFDANGDPMPFPLTPLPNYGGMPFVDPTRAAQMAKVAHEHARNVAVAHAGGGCAEPPSDDKTDVRPPMTTPLDDDKKNALKSQIEFWFSLENLCKDLYLRNQMDEAGFISLHTISRFPKVQKWEVSVAEIMEVLGDSDVLEVHSGTCCVRLKDENMRGQWARVPDDYVWSTIPGAKTPASVR